MDRRTLLKGAGAAVAGAVLGPVAGFSQRSEAQNPDETLWFVEEKRRLQSTYVMFSHSLDADYVPLIMPPRPLIRYGGMNYAAHDAEGEYAYERLLYWNRVKESGFDPLQIDGGGNDFNYSYHHAVSYAGAEGVAQFMPSTWTAAVERIAGGTLADDLGYFNWRDVPQLANLGTYANTGPNNVPPDMQEFVYRVAFTLNPTQWDPFRGAAAAGSPVVTNFINPANYE